MRFYARWPAFIDDIFARIDDAVTMDPVVDAMFDFGKSKFELANTTLSDEGLRNAGVSDPELFKSLGIFTVIAALLLLATGVYLLLHFLDSKFHLCFVAKHRL